MLIDSDTWNEFLMRFILIALSNGKKKILFMKLAQAISRTTRPNMGLFVLILMHYVCWFQIMVTIFNISEFFEKFLKNLYHLYITALQADRCLWCMMLHIIHMWTPLPHKKGSMCILDNMQSTLFCLGKFLKKLADDQCFSITEGSIHLNTSQKVTPYPWK